MENEKLSTINNSNPKIDTVIHKSGRWEKIVFSIFSGLFILIITLLYSQQGRISSLETLTKSIKEDSEKLSSNVDELKSQFSNFKLFVMQAINIQDKDTLDIDLLKGEKNKNTGGWTAIEDCFGEKKYQKNKFLKFLRRLLI